MILNGPVKSIIKVNVKILNGHSYFLLYSCNWRQDVLKILITSSYRPSIFLFIDSRMFDTAGISVTPRYVTWRLPIQFASRVCACVRAKISKERVHLIFAFCWAIHDYSELHNFLPRSWRICFRSSLSFFLIQFITIFCGYDAMR